jgi:uncharacterized protein YbjT (DUF2867 family)
MILVTGAAGKTGRAVCRFVVERGVSVRAFVRRPEQAPVLRARGVSDVVIGDMRDPSMVAHAAEGACAFIHICSNMHPDEIAIGKTAIAAAIRGGVDRFIYYSVLHPQAEEMPHHWNKLRVEEELFRTRLPYTILQPASYMQNILAGWNEIRSAGVYRIPYSAGTRLGLVDLDDVAEATAVVATTDGHEFATYELATDEVITQDEVCRVVARGVGRDVRVEVESRDAWERRARASGLSDYAVNTLLSMFQYYERYGFWGNSRVLQSLLGRLPTMLESFVARMIRDGVDA